MKRGAGRGCGNTAHRLVGAVALLAAAASTGCSTQTVTVSRWLPPQTPLMGVETLAVGWLGGASGTDLQVLLEQALGSSNHFAPIDPEAACALRPDEGSLVPQDASGEADAMRAHARDWALERARDARIDAVVLGHLGAPRSETAFSVVRQGDAQHAHCLITREIDVAIEGALTIVRVADGATLLDEPVAHVQRVSQATATVPEARDGSGCEGALAHAEQQFAPIDADRAALAATAQLARTLVQRLVPHWEGQEVELFVDPQIPASQEAIELLRVGDWDAAVALYREGVAMAGRWPTPKRLLARATYNLGCTLAFGGEGAEGTQLLARAQQLAPEPRIVQQIERARAYGQAARAGASHAHLLACGRDAHGRPWCVHEGAPP